MTSRGLKNGYPPTWDKMYDEVWEGRVRKGSPFFVWVSGLVSTQCDMNVEQGKFSDGDFQGGIRVDNPEDFP